MIFITESLCKYPHRKSVTKEEAYQFLASHPLAFLATIEDGTPYGSCVYFVTDYNLDIFFITKSDTKKAENIQKNKHVALVIASEQKEQMIQVTGNAEVIEDPEMQMYIKKRFTEMFLNAKPTFSFPSAKLTTHDGVIVFKVTPNWARFGDFSKSEIGSVFSQIIP